MTNAAIAIEPGPAAGSLPFPYPIPFEADFELMKSSETAPGDWIVEGYAATPDLDLQADQIAPEALKAAASDLLTNSTVLWNHDPDRPIGVVLEAFADRRGLFVKVKVSKAEADIWRKITEGILNKFSIRGDVLEADRVYIPDLKRYGRIIKRMRLDETSVVSVPANPKAESLGWYIAKALNVVDKEVPQMEPKEKPEPAAAEAVTPEPQIVKSEAAPAEPVTPGPAEAASPAAAETVSDETAKIVALVLAELKKAAPAPVPAPVPAPAAEPAAAEPAAPGPIVKAEPAPVPANETEAPPAPAPVEVEVEPGMGWNAAACVAALDSLEAWAKNQADAESALALIAAIRGEIEKACNPKKPKEAAATPAEVPPADPGSAPVPAPAAPPAAESVDGETVKSLVEKVELLGDALEKMAKIVAANAHPLSLRKGRVGEPEAVVDPSNEPKKTMIGKGDRRALILETLDRIFPDKE